MLWDWENMLNFLMPAVYFKLHHNNMGIKYGCSALDLYWIREGNVSEVKMHRHPIIKPSDQWNVLNFGRPLVSCTSFLPKLNKCSAWMGCLPAVARAYKTMLVLRGVRAAAEHNEMPRASLMLRPRCRRWLA